MSRIGTRPLAQLLRRVGTSMRAGVDVRTIWQKETERGSPTHREKAARVSERIVAGDSLAGAMAACDGYFPQLACDLVEVGETTGRLDEVLIGLADHYEHLLDLRRTFLMGLVWPGLELSAAVFIIGLLIWIMGIVTSGSTGEPIRIFGFEAGTKGLITYVFFIAGIVGAIAWFMIALRRGWFGPKPIEFAMRVPVIGGCLKTAALSRLAWTLSLALDAGMDARRSIKLAIRSTQNAYYTSQMDEVDAAIVQGREFHEALRGTGLFPDEFLSSLETAEVSGTHSESLTRLANDYRDRAKAAAKALTVASTFAVLGLGMLIMVVLIFQLFFTLIMPMYTDPMNAFS